VSDNLIRKGAGRPKGSPNKVAKAAKEAIAEAAEMLGGVERIVNWAKEAPENEKAFWATIYPKLIPVQLNADINATVTTKEQRDAAVAAAVRADS
jgi:hypothetical protein